MLHCDIKLANPASHISSPPPYTQTGMNIFSPRSQSNGERTRLSTHTTRISPIPGKNGRAAKRLHGCQVDPAGEKLLIDSILADVDEPSPLFFSPDGYSNCYRVARTYSAFYKQTRLFIISSIFYSRLLL